MVNINYHQINLLGKIGLREVPVLKKAQVP